MSKKAKQQLIQITSIVIIVVVALAALGVAYYVSHGNSFQTTTTTAGYWVRTDKSSYALYENVVITVPSTCVLPCAGASIYLNVIDPSGGVTRLTIPSNGDGQTPLPVMFQPRMQGTYTVQYVSQIVYPNATPNILAITTFQVYCNSQPNTTSC